MKQNSIKEFYAMNMHETIQIVGIVYINNISKRYPLNRRSSELCSGVK